FRTVRRPRAAGVLPAPALIAAAPRLWPATASAIGWCLFIGAQRFLKPLAIPGERPLRAGDAHQKQEDQGIECQGIVQVVVEALPASIPFYFQPLAPRT